MNYNTMKATIKGATCEGIPFFEELLFTLIPPAMVITMEQVIT